MVQIIVGLEVDQETHFVTDVIVQQIVVMEPLLIRKIVLANVMLFGQNQLPKEIVMFVHKLQINFVTAVEL
jgi:hypothetical protein